MLQGQATCAVLIQPGEEILIRNKRFRVLAVVPSMHGASVNTAG
jgi:hypothetical protein